MNDITVCFIGLPEVEEKRLHMAFLSSKKRHIKYKITNLERSPNILLVNADDPTSLIMWRRYRNFIVDAMISEPISVLVSTNSNFKTKHYQIRRPLIVSRTISMLDKISINEFGLKRDQAFVNETKTKDILLSEKSEEYCTKNKHKALVVDDSLPVRIQMNRILKPIVSHIDFACNGEEALELIDNNNDNYHIIFLDIILPGMDGYEICKLIKQGKEKKTPVIMLTGNSSPADMIRGKLVGCDTYLIKPVVQSIFKEVVLQYLKDPYSFNKMIS